MVKKLIGIVVAMAVIVVIVLATIRRDEFRSMVWQEELQQAEKPAPVGPAPAQPTPVEPTPVELPDSAATHLPDSL